MKEIVKLGQLLESAEQRDAIHVAVIPCYTGYTWSPGSPVHVKKHGDGYWARPHTEQCPAHGIVDPFLMHSVGPGHRFYVMLYPNTIESLRHVWRHPIIDGDAK